MESQPEGLAPSALHHEAVVAFHLDVEPRRAPSSEPLPVGTFLGAFEVLSLVGHGGMGAVYCVRNRITGDLRALKLMLPELAANRQFVDRFVREIRLAMAVEHPNLVRVFEPGMDGDQIFLPMELLQGEPLSARLRRGGTVPVTDAVALLQAIGGAIEALHERGILHRDIKPSNVFLAVDGGCMIPKLLDLGAGKEVGATEEATATGFAIGSPHYMAPEQAAGRKDIDARVDQYGLAVVGYQLLTGARPYENDDTGHVLAKLLAGVAYKKPSELRRGIPPEVEDVILKAMSRGRDDRFPSVADFVAALGAERVDPLALDESSTRFAPLLAPVPFIAGNERTGTTAASVRAQDVRTRGHAWFGAAAALVIFGAAGLFMTLHGRSTHAPSDTTAGGASQASPSSAASASSSSSAASPRPAPPTSIAEPPREAARVTPPSMASAPTSRSTRPQKPTPAEPAVEPCHPTAGSPCL